MSVKLSAESACVQIPFQLFLENKGVILDRDRTFQNHKWYGAFYALTFIPILLDYCNTLLTGLPNEDFNHLLQWKREMCCELQTS